MKFCPNNKVCPHIAITLWADDMTKMKKQLHQMHQLLLANDVYNKARERTAVSAGSDIAIQMGLPVVDLDELKVFDAKLKDKANYEKMVCSLSFIISFTVNTPGENRRP